MLVSVFILATLLHLSEVSGLRCWTCENARSELECQRKGHLQTCQENEKQCQNEVRRGGHGLMISKRCKQLAACSNNFVQNSQFQCEYYQWSSVCRCCCSSYHCNSPGLACRKMPRCENQLGKLRNGEVTCEEGNTFGSRCFFHCKEGYYVQGDLYKEGNKCMRDGEWDKPAPCCSRNCSLSALDIIIALDSSSSIGAENWITMTTMVKNFVTDLASNPEIHVGVFRYNEEVDVESHLLLKDYKTSGTKSFISAIDAMNYTGLGTNTGAALQHAVQVMLSDANGHRPSAEDVVLVITDGKSSDDVKSVAAQLHQHGTTVLVVGIVSSSGSLDFAQLRDMASNENLILVARRGFKQLDAAFLRQIRDSICGTCHN